ncbi:MAG: Plug domain-containing protein, partial [Comamonadaceae bacterium]
MSHRFRSSPSFCSPGNGHQPVPCATASFSGFQNRQRPSRGLRRLTPVAACILLASTVFNAALAQSLSSVTVSATRTELPPFDVPASVDVIDGERLRGDGRAQLNLSESLALVPGLSARDRQNQAQDLQLSVRGFGARSTFGVRGVRIYVDGIPATMPDGQGQLSHIGEED